MNNLEFTDRFESRHIGVSDNEQKEMLNDIGVNSLEELIDLTVPGNIRIKSEPELPEPVSEYEVLNELKEIAKKNNVYKSYIGMGYYGTILPSVIKRNILENPGWYTQYTPYQPEISQGRLEALINFQTTVCDLTALPLANASLLDEATAAAEAMMMCYNARPKEKKNANVLLMSKEIFPQTIDVIKTRALPRNIELRIVPTKEMELNDDVFALLVQYPNDSGNVIDYQDLFSRSAEKNILNIVIADLLSLTLLKAPGEFGADVAVGTTQRFGVPMGFGGPHAAYFATKDKFKRFTPGRIIGVSVDSRNRFVYRMALQTREQHIKRERATSNICTAQALLAIMAGMYAVYHGAKGLTAIASRIHSLTTILDNNLKQLGFTQTNEVYFDTLKIVVKSKGDLQGIQKIAKNKKVNFRYFDSFAIGISLDETTTLEDVKTIVKIFAEESAKDFVSSKFEKNVQITEDNIPGSLKRKSTFLTHPVFNKYYSETEMMRYIKSLENKDLSLTRSMIPLGSCTMKLNAATELIPITWPEFSDLHPFIPSDQSKGYLELFDKLEKYLCELTGFSAVSFQPNSGAQGEFAGLMTIRAYHHHKGDSNRNVVLIPSSAHGTNPASAVMAGNEVVIVKCDDNGNIELNDLKEKAELYKDRLSAFMVTYPSTHGIFETDIKEMIDIVHQNGGLVHMDGANMNAQLGLTTPAEMGADVCHLNLHKTFAIPHGGGGPGVGPIAVAKHLVPFLPGHPIVNINNSNSISAVSAAPWGSANILVISYAFIRMLGTKGLKKVAEISILNANYLKAKLEKYYKVLYKGANGYVGHELIFDTREFKHTVHVEVDDIAKRLMDYGFHAPTVSFPVPGTLMVEPTESESKAELDRFCNAMISIWNEIKEIENGSADTDDNVLKNAPHTADDIVIGEWTHSYTREQAVYPVSSLRENKFWVPVNRIDNAYGDRHLVCSCPPIEDYK